MNIEECEKSLRVVFSNKKVRNAANMAFHPDTGGTHEEFLVLSSLLAIADGGEKLKVPKPKAVGRGRRKELEAQLKKCEEEKERLAKRNLSLILEKRKLKNELASQKNKLFIQEQSKLLLKEAKNREIKQFFCLIRRAKSKNELTSILKALEEFLK